MPVYKKQQAETPPDVSYISNEDLAKIVSRNINRLCPTRKYPKKTIAKLCHVSTPLVSGWTSASSPQLPGVHYLLTIAEYFGVEISYLLTDHGSDDMALPDRVHTYSDAWVALIQLKCKGILQPEHVEDAILKYLLDRYFHLSNLGLSTEDFYDWMMKILQDFAVPITIFRDKEVIYQDISKNEEGIVAIDDDTRYRNIARALAEPDTVRDCFRRVYGPAAQAHFEEWCEYMRIDMQKYDDGDWDNADWNPDEDEDF